MLKPRQFPGLICNVERIRSWGVGAGLLEHLKPYQETLCEAPWEIAAVCGDAAILSTLHCTALPAREVGKSPY